MTHKLVGVINGLATLWLGASLIILGMLAFDDEVAAGLSLISPSNHLVVKELEYRDGLIYQHVEPLLGGVIEADWSAGIYRTSDQKLICNGHGAWDYGIKHEAIGFSLSDWTGGQCSGVEQGVEYTARAKWVYYCDNDDGPDQCVTQAEIKFVAGE